ncbi:MAG: SDR family NAD(P)-dependent oxidoreductase [Treponema sp.]|nr:SDR family NAD(P)-dependent oxidoreductase [Treponema sp.]
MKKIIIVTGASSGLGVCFARQLSKESADFRRCNKTECASDEIWLLARREDRLLDTRQQILQDAANYEKPEYYPAVKVCPVDLSGKAGAVSVKQMLEQYQKEEPFFQISVLVNNAGFGTYGEFANTDTEREMNMVDVNCTALTGIVGFALPWLKKGSRLINTASLASFLPLGNFAVYGATKSYVLSFTVVLAAELKGKGISVTALCPGPVSTEFADVASKGARKEVRHGLSPEKTVAHCLKKSRKGKLYAIMAFNWKFQAAASRFVGRYVGAWFTYAFCKRPSN